MTIETKYSPGDTVFFMKDNQIQSSTVFSIQANITSQDSIFTYRLVMNENPYKESDIFASAGDVVSNLTSSYPEIQSSIISMNTKITS